NQVTFSIFDRDLANRHADYDRALETVRSALLGEPLVPGGPPMFPTAPHLVETMWEATFGVEGATRFARRRSGLLLSRTQPRPAREPGAPRLHISELQTPIVEAYLANWSSRYLKPRIGLSRSVYVASTREEALADAARGIGRHAARIGAREGLNREMSTEELLFAADVHIGSPEDVAESILADRLLPCATDLMVQVHPVDPSHEKTRRSLEL